MFKKIKIKIFEMDVARRIGGRFASNHIRQIETAEFVGSGRPEGTKLYHFAIEIENVQRRYHPVNFYSFIHSNIRNKTSSGWIAFQGPY